MVCHVNVFKKDGEFWAVCKEVSSMWEKDISIDGAIQKFKNSYTNFFETLPFANGEKVTFDFHVVF